MSVESGAPDGPPARSDRRGGMLRFLPLAVFIAMAGVFSVMLMSGRNAQDVPTALAGKPAPAFDLPPVENLKTNGAPVPGLATADLKTGKVTVVNVFASWCGPCREEHPQILALSKDARISIVGINQKDKPADAVQFLTALGNPYAAVGADSNGRVSIDWGVYGVPETFILRADGTVAFKKVGPISADDLEKVVKPEIEKALRPSL